MSFSRGEPKATAEAVRYMQIAIALPLAALMLRRRLRQTDIEISGQAK